jgi:hypothetical protein
VAEFIHESLLKSEGHRENILDPDFTQVGIGIVNRDGKGYYITQVFLRPLLFQTDTQVRQIILERINRKRDLMALPPLDLWQEADQFAQNLAERKAAGLDLPEIPQELRETLIVFLSTPSLAQEELNFPEAVNPRYNKGTLGVWFGKNGDYPGGVYVFALMLFAENSLSTLSIEEQKKFVLNLVNKIRTQNGLKILFLDEQLSQAAERTAAKAARKLEILPLPEYTKLKKIGIGLVYKKNPGFPKGTFFISLIFE